jgi:UDP-2,3-diacylglucosamine hydrolase
LSGIDAALFCSDMHLDAAQPDKAAQFLDQLLLVSQECSHLFLLGDIFEAWVGDDQADGVAINTQRALATIAARGTAIAIITGNRDFLLGESLPTGMHGFDWRTVATLLPDPFRIDLFGQAALLSHGDGWCVDDRSYQDFRALRNQPQWRADFLARPLAQRLRLASQMRAQSQLETANKALYLTDVNATAVERDMMAAQAHCVVHGHTHRPAQHQWQHKSHTMTRWVLPDWTADSQRGGFLVVRRDGWQQLGNW